MIISEKLGIEEKLRILSDAAKYDVACTSSGSDRRGKSGSIGNTSAAGICHAFAADGRCISLLKILMTNECVYSCQYCLNRSKNDVLRATFTPEEVARLTIEFYRRNYIEGLFLSSGIYPDPDTTVRRMMEAVWLLRRKYCFNGYIHVKSIPGADPVLTQQLGWLCDRMSINLELPTGEGLRALAPNKSRKSILTPMRMVQQGIHQNPGNADRYLGGGGKHAEKTLGQSRLILPVGKEQISTQPTEEATRQITARVEAELQQEEQSAVLLPERPSDGMRRFVPAGQSTQMIIGATRETDFQIMAVTEALYRRYELKRVFYSGFINVNHDSDLPSWQGRTILDREHRLYQADFLLRFYGFRTEDLLTPDRPNFNMLVDPKCDYALRHLEQFPVEVNRASYEMLLRVPGIGVTSARRIMAARRNARLDFPDLKNMGVVLKRAVYFITCQGRRQTDVALDEDRLLPWLTDPKKRRQLAGDDMTYRQLTLFDFGLTDQDTPVLVQED